MGDLDLCNSGGGDDPCSGCVLPVRKEGQIEVSIHSERLANSERLIGWMHMVCL